MPYFMLFKNKINVGFFLLLGQANLKQLNIYLNIYYIKYNYFGFFLENSTFQIVVEI